MNSRDTLVTDLNVLEDFNPIVPDTYQGAEFLMLGNLMPKLQLSVINQLKIRPKLIVMDTMNFWMDIAMDDLDPLVEVFPLQKQYQWCNHIFVSHPYAMLEFFETAFF